MRCYPSPLALSMLAVCFSLSASANVIHVPADQPTIQAGINAAANGDTVLVSPGTYKENINFNGKAITVKSQSGPAVTIIDGQQLAPVATMTTNETRQAVLTGFTLQNGKGNYDGGGIFTNASPTIRGNVITLNTFCSAGGGIASEGGGPLIQNNIIHNNLQVGCSGGVGGGGVVILGGSGAEIIGNVIADNSDWVGGGISIWGTSGLVTIKGNTISRNVGGGVYVQTGAPATTNVIQNLIVGNAGTGLNWSNPPLLLVSNTIADNAPGAFYGEAAELAGGSMDNTVTIENNLLFATTNASAFSCTFYDTNNLPIFDHNDVFSADTSAYGGVCPDLTGTNGNLSADPFFVALFSNDYHLPMGSPVIDVGNNAAPNLPSTDFDADPRIVNSTVDIGADEYSLPTTLTLSNYSLRYGSQQVGTSSSAQTVTLTNNGTTTTNLRLVATGSDYGQTNNCGASLAAGASCQLDVTFAPVGGGSRNSVLGIIASATANPLVVNLTGTGLAPSVNLYPSYLYFSGQVVGTTGTQPATLTNTGQAPLTISSIVLSGASDFGETNDCPMAPATLAVSASCTITVTWTPLTITSESATITITDNAFPSPQTIYASGTSYSAGIATVVPNALTFPDTLIGNSSQPQTVTLTNTGTGALGNINISSSGDFQVNSSCPTSMAPGASCTFTVTFTPTFQGNEYGYIYVYNDSPNSGFVSAAGIGDAAVPTLISLSPSSIAAGSGDTSVIITGTGFVYSSQVRFNGTTLSGYYNSSTQFTVTIPAADLTTAGTAQITMFTPAPGGGTSNPLTLTIFAPVNYASQSTTYSPRTITGTNLDLFYYGSALITSPFAIQYGGGSYTNLYVGAGGTISFSGYFSNEYNDVIPTTQTATLVAPFWANLYPFGTGNNNNVFWQVNGTAPNRELVIEWRNVPYCCSPDATHTIRFQVVFFEGSSNILFIYGDTVFGGQYSGNDNGATATVGVQVASGQGTQFSYNTAALASKTALLWFPNMPTVTLSTSTLDFGYHMVGTPSLPQKLTLTNGGLVALDITSITTDNADFTQANTCGSSVPPGGNCTIQVKFTPSQPTAESATLTINDNAIGGPQKVTLNGIGAVTPVTVFPIILNFGGVTVGNSSALPVTLANASNQNLTIQQITTSPSVYTQSNNCGASVAPGASCTISVTFTPTQTGAVKGTLSMALNGKPPVTKVKMTGTGN